MDIEEQFEILREYKRRCREYDGDDACQSPPPAPPPNEEKCWHNHQVVNEGQYVCTTCGLVLGNVLMAEVNVFDRCVLPRSYAARERLSAVDKHLIRFMERTGVQVQLHGVQERLQFMKKDSGYKSLNYAIALSCICHEDKAACYALRSYLPKSNVSWARSSRLVSCMPRQFSDIWLRHLLINAKPLTRRQSSRLNENLDKFCREQNDAMRLLIESYGCGSDRHVDSLPDDLRCALYRFSCAAIKPRAVAKRRKKTGAVPSTSP